MEQEHIPILKAFDDLKFNLGKRTLANYIKGDINPTIERNNLEELDSYGCLYMLERGEILNLIEQLLKNGYLETLTVGSGFEVLSRTSKGLKEISEKSFIPQKKNITIPKFNLTYKETEITDNERKLFKTFDFLLNKYNDEQKKSIISPEKNILCIAGAGSGKTTVLTKRIEFLIKFKSVPHKKILGITFSRKAKEEMEHRLKNLEVANVIIETFNSFCERTLKKYGNKIYKGEVKVAQYRDKISIISSALKKTGTSFDTFYEDYFNRRQLREKSKDDLFFIFVNDIFTIIDYYKNLEKNIEKFYERENNTTKKRIANIIYNIAVETQKILKERNLRDFSDQITDTLKLFRENKNLIPNFEHILVDEFQDINLIQFELLKLLNSQNLFAVGDPRQAIYGWRGAEIKFILNFPKHFENTQIIQLKNNYRSQKQILEFANESIKSLGLINLSYTKENENKNCVFLFEQNSELLEKRFVLEAIKNSQSKRNEIFVLARTNRILKGYADFFSQNGVKYSIKSEEEYKNAEPKENEVVLATVHSIKGMEANEVYLVSCNSISFPNKVADNFVFQLMKSQDYYNKNSEELRLFYVAITRAKEKLIITYSGNYSKFINSNMLSLLKFNKNNISLFNYGNSKEYKSDYIDKSNSTALKNMIKSWRTDLANKTGLPSYMIISNKAIDDLVIQRPHNKVQLLNINGLGDVKIAKYGDELIRIING